MAKDGEGVDLLLAGGLGGSEITGEADRSVSMITAGESTVDGSVTAWWDGMSGLSGLGAVMCGSVALGAPVLEGPAFERTGSASGMSKTTALEPAALEGAEVEDSDIAGPAFEVPASDV